MNKIGFGGGCHWCTEAVFQIVKGVDNVEQGWIASGAPNDSFSEAVIVHFDPKKTSLPYLISVHLKTHSCTSDHSMRKKYRSAIYTFSEEQIPIVTKSIRVEQKEFKDLIITKVLPFVSFKENKEEYQNYYLKNPKKSFCVRFIEPKIELIKTL